MPGLTDTNNQTDTTVVANTTTQPVANYTASTGNVSASETVAGNLDSLLSNESSYIKRARAGATETANSRGLMNSSIAAGAGEAAAIDRALPIAQQDAGTKFQNRITNQGAENAASQFNTGALNQDRLQTRAGEIETGLIGSRTAAALTVQEQTSIDNQVMATLQGEITSGHLKTQAEIDERKLALTTQYEKELIEARTGSALTVQEQKSVDDRVMATLQGEIDSGHLKTQAEIDERKMELATQYEKELIASRTEATLTVQEQTSIDDRVMAKLQGEIDEGLIKTQQDWDERKLALTTQYEKELIEARTGGESVLMKQAYTQTLGTMEAQANIDERKAEYQNTYNESLAKLNADLTAGTIMQAEFDNKVKLMDAAQEYSIATMDRQAEINTAITQLNADLTAGTIMPAQFAHDLAVLETQYENALGLQTAQNDFAKILQELKGDQAIELSNIEGTYKTLIQASASASALFQDVVRALSLVYADPTMTTEQKAAAAKATANTLESGLTIIGAAADIDLADLLDFDV